MIQKFTLHTHSIGFDGRAAPDEMVARAELLGFDTIGISNHFILHHDIQNTNFYPFAVVRGYQNIYSTSFDEIMNRFVPHYKELDRIANTSNIRVLRGVEVDFFPTSAWQLDFKRAMAILRPDYIIGACHFIEFDGMLRNVYDMANAEPDIQDKMLTQYWQNIQAASASGLFTWLAHLDLPKKAGILQDSRWTDVELGVVETLAKNRTAIEINTGLESEPYPSRRILQHVSDNNIPVLFSDDAHAPDQIGRRFDVAAQICHDCGITNFFIPDCIK